MTKQLFLILWVVVAASSCGGDGVRSGVYTLDFSSITETAVADGALSTTLPINSVTFKEDVDSATAKFGHVPKHMQVVAAAFDLDPSKSSVSGYEQVFSEDVVVFITPTGGSSVDVGSRTKPTGSERQDIGVQSKVEDFDSALTTYFDGDFVVGLRGTAGGVNAGDFNANVTVYIQFEFLE
ncbi:MAG TPA: hypothetical protein VI895_11055 [Bdellovibrionota bacterium]|nr:hypothetical protein [Bdellovibrionota bacterium]